MINILANKLDDFIEHIKKIQDEYSFSDDIPNINKKTLRYYDCDTMYSKVLEFYETAFVLFNDFQSFLEKNKDNRSKIMHRLKAEESFIKKWEKHCSPGKEKKLYKACNDNVAFRCVIDCKEEELIDLINSIDLKSKGIEVIDFYSKAKTNDDGYRGIHLYFWYNRRNYPIEFQIWTIKDSILQSYTHEVLYKNGNEVEKQEYSLKLRQWIDSIPQKPESVDLDFLKYLNAIHNKSK